MVLAGSIPDTLPGDVYESILRRLQGRGIRFVVDATKDLLKNVLKYHPFLIKPNHHELGELFGVAVTDGDEIAGYAGKLQELGARNVLVSMAGDGALLKTEDGSVYKSPAPKGKVINSVGAGDSMVAGLPCRVSANWKPANRLPYGSSGRKRQRLFGKAGYERRSPPAACSHVRRKERMPCASPICSKKKASI